MSPNGLSLPSDLAAEMQARQQQEMLQAQQEQAAMIRVGMLHTEVATALYANMRGRNAKDESAAQARRMAKLAARDAMFLLEELGIVSTRPQAANDEDPQ